MNTFLDAQKESNDQLKKLIIAKLEEYGADYANTQLSQSERILAKGKLLGIADTIEALGFKDPTAGYIRELANHYKL